MIRKRKLVKLSMGTVIAWSLRQLRDKSVRRVGEVEGDLNGWTTSEAGQTGWRMQSFKLSRETSRSHFRVKAR